MLPQQPQFLIFLISISLVKFVVLGEICTELSINPVENDVMLDSCFNNGWDSCGQDQTTCTMFSDLFGSGWQILDDVTEQMADQFDESAGRLPVYGKMVGSKMMYLYFSVSSIVQGKRPGGRWVFGTTIGTGYGGDWGQAQVSLPCMSPF